MSLYIHLDACVCISCLWIMLVPLRQKFTYHTVEQPYCIIIETNSTCILKMILKLLSDWYCMHVYALCAQSLYIYKYVRTYCMYVLITQ